MSRKKSVGPPLSFPPHSCSFPHSAPSCMCRKSTGWCLSVASVIHAGPAIVLILCQVYQFACKWHFKIGMLAKFIYILRWSRMLQNKLDTNSEVINEVTKKFFLAFVSNWQATLPSWPVVMSSRVSDTRWGRKRQWRRFESVNHESDYLPLRQPIQKVESK